MAPLELSRGDEHGTHSGTRLSSLLRNLMLCLLVKQFDPLPTEPKGVKQIARNLTDTFDGFLIGKRYLLMDRDTKFCAEFRSILEDEDVESLLLPSRRPDLNSYIGKVHEKPIS